MTRSLLASSTLAGALTALLLGAPPAWAQSRLDAANLFLKGVTDEMLRQEQERARQRELDMQRAQEEQRLSEEHQRAQAARSAQERQLADERARAEKVAQLRRLPPDMENYDGQPCAFFNVPTLQIVNGAERWFFHDDGAWVCHQDRMYQCVARKWQSKGMCTDWGTPASRTRVQSHVLEGAPPRPRRSAVAAAAPAADGENPFRPAAAATQPTGAASAPAATPDADANPWRR